MKYWVKSCPPLIVKAAWIETTVELIHWIETLLKESKKEESWEDPKDDLDLLDHCLVVRKVAEPIWEKLLSGDNFYIDRPKRTFPHIEKELLRTKNAKVEKRGRKKKIVFKSLKELKNGKKTPCPA